VQAVSFNDTSPTVGEPVSVTALVWNEGDRSGTRTIALRVDGEVVDSREVGLDAGEIDEVEFVWSFDDTGTREVGIGSVTAGTVTVERDTGTEATTTGTPTAAGTPTDEGIAVIDATSVYSWVRSGFNGSVRVTVANRDDERASRELTVRVDGDPVATREVTLEPDRRREVTIEFPATEGTVTVEGVEAGELRVGEENSDPPSEGTETEATGPGFGAGTGIAAFAALAALLWRRDR
jgi:hypothetical protein